MMLDRVTITGADDSVKPAELFRLSEEYPFVEWGVLFGSEQGRARFPTRQWLVDFFFEVPAAVRVSAHLCGIHVRSGFMGPWTFLAEWAWVYERANRLQWNFHGQRVRHRFDELAGHLRVAPPTQEGWIFQLDDVSGNYVFDALRAVDPRCVPLFDTSGGAGLVPQLWSRPRPGFYCGYAGGLGPDNVLSELDRIEHVAGPERIWIDMERRVRSDDDAAFDLAKVRRVLEQVAPRVR
jgi:hypothetical protein